jgi:hypothetical protein
MWFISLLLKLVSGVHFCFTLDEGENIIYGLGNLNRPPIYADDVRASRTYAIVIGGTNLKDLISVNHKGVGWLTRSGAGGKGDEVSLAHFSS